MNEMNERYGSTKDVALAIGISKQRVIQLIQEGILPRYKLREYPIELCKKAYFDYMSASDRPNGAQKAIGSPAAARHEKLAAEAALKNLELAKKAGDLVDATELRAIWAQAGATIRERILQAAERIVTKMEPFVSDKAALDTIVRDEIESALRVISEAPPHA